MPHCIRSVHKSDYCKWTLILSLRSLVPKHSNLGHILTRTYFLTIVLNFTVFCLFFVWFDSYFGFHISLTMPTAFVSIVYLGLLTLFFFCTMHTFVYISDLNMSVIGYLYRCYICMSILQNHNVNWRSTLSNVDRYISWPAKYHSLVFQSFILENYRSFFSYNVDDLPNASFSLWWCGIDLFQ